MKRSELQAGQVVAIKRGKHASVEPVIIMDVQPWAKSTRIAPRTVGRPTGSGNGVAVASRYGWDANATWHPTIVPLTQLVGPYEEARAAEDAERRRANAERAAKEQREHAQFERCQALAARLEAVLDTPVSPYLRDGRMQLTMDQAEALLKRVEAE